MEECTERCKQSLMWYIHNNIQLIYHSQLRVAADWVWKLAPTANSLLDVVCVYVVVGKAT